MMGAGSSRYEVHQTAEIDLIAQVALERLRNGGAAGGQILRRFVEGGYLAIHRIHHTPYTSHPTARRVSWLLYVRFG